MGIVVAPGGWGTRQELKNPILLDWLRARATEAETVTSAGISAGIDMALKVVQRYFGSDIARATARHMEFPYPDSDARRVQL